MNKPHGFRFGGALRARWKASCRGRPRFSAPSLMFHGTHVGLLECLAKAGASRHRRQPPDDVQPVKGQQEAARRHPAKENPLKSSASVKGEADFGRATARPLRLAYKVRQAAARVIRYGEKPGRRTPVRSTPADARTIR